jgi:hypothetical protein
LPIIGCLPQMEEAEKVTRYAAVESGARYRRIGVSSPDTFSNIPIRW